MNFCGSEGRELGGGDDWSLPQTGAFPFFFLGFDFLFSLHFYLI